MDQILRQKERKSNPKDINIDVVAFRLGSFCEEKGNNQRALEFFNRAIELNPSLTYYNSKLKVLEKMGNDEELRKTLVEISAEQEKNKHTSDNLLEKFVIERSIEDLKRRKKFLQKLKGSEGE